MIDVICKSDTDQGFASPAAVSCSSLEPDGDVSRLAANKRYLRPPRTTDAFILLSFFPGIK